LSCRGSSGFFPSSQEQQKLAFPRGIVEDSRLDRDGGAGVRAQLGQPGPWPMALGPWPMAHGPWPMAHGPWPMAHGPWPRAQGPWPMGPYNGSKSHL
jgi:hypothetical protein